MLLQALRPISITFYLQNFFSKYEDAQLFFLNFHEIKPYNFTKIKPMTKQSIDGFKIAR